MLCVRVKGMLAYDNAKDYRIVGVARLWAEGSAAEENFDAGFWETRTLSDSSIDPGMGVTLNSGSNSFTLEKGLYMLSITQPFFRSRHSTGRLYDVTNSTVFQNGTTGYSNHTDAYALGYVYINTLISPSGSTEYVVQAFTNEHGGVGRGSTRSPTDSGVPRYGTEVMITQLN